MEKFRVLINEANKAFETADHLAYMTYPIVQDVKLMITIAENINIALTKGMEAILYYDWLYKRIYELPTSFKEQFELFKTKSAPRYNIPRDFVILIEDIRKVIEQRRKSSVEFVRKDQFVIASNNYGLKVIDIKKIKEYLVQTKLFVRKLNELKESFDKRFNIVPKFKIKI